MSGVIVADNGLPDLFGKVQGIPFVLVRGALPEQLALRTLQRGAEDYLVKHLGARIPGHTAPCGPKTLYRKTTQRRNSGWHWAARNGRSISHDSRRRTIHSRCAAVLHSSPFAIPKMRKMSGTLPVMPDIRMAWRCNHDWIF